MQPLLESTIQAVLSTIQVVFLHWIEIGEGLIEQVCVDVSTRPAEIVGTDAVRETTLTLTTQLQEVRERYSFY